MGFVDIKCRFLAVKAQPQIQIKFKMINSENSTTKGMHKLCVCIAIGQACGHERLSLMYERIVLYHGKSQLTEFLITFLVVYCVKHPIISADHALLSSTSSE